MKRIALIAISPILALGLVYIALRYFVFTFANPEKAMHIALMIDEASNVSANGRVDETISARAAKAQIAGRKWGCILCKILDAIQKDHCVNALKDDVTTV